MRQIKLWNRHSVLIGLLLLFNAVLSHAYEVSTTVYVTKSLGTPHGSTWISSYYPSINFSNDDWLWVSDDANDVARVLIGVSISGLMPSNSVINSAYLYAYNTDGDGGKNVYAYRITSDWDIDSVTWDNKPSYNASSLDIKYVNYNYTEAWYNWSITSAVQGWYSGSLPNYGVILRAVEDSSIGSIAHLRSHKFTDGSGPYVKIYYTPLPPTPSNPYLTNVDNPPYDLNGSYTFGWDAVAEADYYDVYENGSRVGAAGQPTSNSWPVSGKTDGTYCYEARAQNAAGPSGWTAPEKCVVLDTVSPNNPSSCSAWKTSSKAIPISSGIWQTETSNPYFEWNTPTDNGDSGLAGCYYYYGASAVGDPATWITNNYYDAGADPGTPGTYYLRIKTKDNAGNVSISSTVFVVKYDGPPQITNLAAKTSSAGSAITASTWQTDNDPYFYWSAPASASALEGYSWAWDAQPDDVADTPPGTAMYYQTSDDFLSNGQHTFYIKAKNNIGWGSAASFDIWVDASLPVLTWTGEDNYISDGLHPESGRTDENFIFRVKFADTDNEAPQNGYPRVHIKKNGQNIVGSPFTMDAVDPADNNYADGKIYVSTRTLAAGTDYIYFFDALNSLGASASGLPVGEANAPDVYAHNAPLLSYLGSGGYTSDGLDPETGDPNTSFTFKVRYADPDNDASKAGWPKVYIKKSGANISGSPFTMSEIDLGDTVFSDGKDYYKALSLEGGAYSYYFTASDMYEVQAVGDPISEKNGPAVVNGAPTSGVKVYHSVFKPGQAEKTYISFNPSAAGNTTVKIYDTAGRAVRTLYDGPSAPGINTVTWDGTDSGGAKVSSGVYLIRIEGPGIKQQKKVVAIR